MVFEVRLRCEGVAGDVSSVDVVGRTTGRMEVSRPGEGRTSLVAKSAKTVGLDVSPLPGVSSRRADVLRAGLLEHHDVAQNGLAHSVRCRNGEVGESGTGEDPYHYLSLGQQRVEREHH